MGIPEGNRLGSVAHVLAKTPSASQARWASGRLNSNIFTPNTPHRTLGHPNSPGVLGDLGDLGVVASQ
jgi:hypothetical protein